ncbi:MAG: hypothetical protein QOI38_2727 [Sphingomonadales bacterium]|jgi:hypothetical protein|nr:hypothetical protein [Sphingomonadales bacterium]
MGEPDMAPRLSATIPRPFLRFELATCDLAKRKSGQMQNVVRATFTVARAATPEYFLKAATAATFMSRSALERPLAAAI